MRYHNNFFVIFFLICFIACTNIEPAPPSTTEMAQVGPYYFLKSANSNELVAMVNDISTYLSPNPDCGSTVSKKIYWDFSEQHEYIDVTIFDHAGVDPGYQNERGYTLLSFDRNGNQTSYFPLIMRQSDSATERLYQMRWRLKINANERRIEQEMGYGNISPLPGQPPFERAVSVKKPIGNKWVLRIPAVVSPEYITATLYYNLRKKNIQICK